MKTKFIYLFAIIAVILIVIIILAGIFNSSIFTGGVDGLSPKIALININNEIQDTTHTLELLNFYADMPAVKVILLRVNSPGGGVAASQEVYRQIVKIKQKGKKVVVSMTDVAASGAFYISVAADKIYANPGTITGSIGVIMSYANAKQLLDKIGLQFTTVKSGKYKDVGSFSRDASEGEKRLLKNMIDDVLNQFVDDILNQRLDKIAKAAGIDIKDRAKKREAVKEYMLKDVADGRIFTGKQALTLGLVDELGNIDDAIEGAAKMVGLKGRPKVISEKKDEPWANFLKSTMNALNLKNKTNTLQYLFN
ncbi:MAG: signal peptide peptidase SppA [bacterium]